MLIKYGYVPNKIIKRIFQDHWEEFLGQHKDKIPKDMQSSVVEAVSKMLKCGTKEMGFVWHPEYGVLYDIITDGPFDNEQKQKKEEQSNSPPEEVQLYLPMHPVWV